MSRLFPHTPYAEDQPLAHTILTTHVLHRAMTTGAAVGLVLYPAGQLARRALSYRNTSTRPVTTIPTAATPSTTLLFRRPTLPPTALLTVLGRSVIITTALLGLALPYMMRGKEEIEWQDRSWRLLENKSQVQVDEWSAGGAGAGVAVAAFVPRRATGTRMAAAGAGAGVGVSSGVARSAVRFAGAAGLGSLVACGAFWAWSSAVRSRGTEDEGRAVVKVEPLPVLPVMVQQRVVDGPQRAAAAVGEILG